MQHEDKYLYQLADKAGMSSNTARKYLRLGKLPSELKKPRDYKTREDAFWQVWWWVEDFLKNNAGMEAKALFEQLMQEYPGKFKPNQLRSFQRRVKRWRAMYGPAKEVFFEQVYKPGEFGASDFTRMKNEGITINGSPFEHMLYHFVLCLSNWETFTIVYSESFESLSLGIQNALWELGKVPKYHRTDNLTAAVSKAGADKEYTDNYKALASHYGFEATSIQPAHPNENGDVEQSHYRLKNAIEQALILRGSKDFGSIEEYEKFLRKIVKQRNSQRRDVLASEIDVMKQLPQKRYDAYQDIKCRVSKFATIRVKKNTYSVHSRLIGSEVTAKVLPDYIELWYANKRIETLPRLRGSSNHRIDYRHIIDTLIRKPGAFENYKYKDDLFPTSIFRVAHDMLREMYGQKRGNKQYLKILELAAKENEAAVNKALKTLIDNSNPVSFELVEAIAKSENTPSEIEDVYIAKIDLGFYDNLLEELI